MANVKKESTSNGGGMVSGLLLRYVLNNLEIHHRILRF
jgi:hypothetical protein